MSKVNQELYAFWEYSEYPYALGGKVLEFCSDGMVKVEGYWGFKFKPIKILPLKEGKEKNLELKKLEKKYKQEVKKLSEDYYSRANKVIGV